MCWRGYKILTRQLDSERKDMNDMSFVGIHNIREGIIAFADSKCTLLFENGRVIEDSNRKEIQKVFKNNQFVFVTYGNNELFSEEYKTNMEDYICKNLLPDMDYESFFKKMDDDIQNNPGKYNNGQYDFIIGTKNKNGKYYILKCTIKVNERIRFYDKTYEKRYFVGGDKLYRTIYQQHCFYHDVPILKYSLQIKEFVENLVKMENCFSEYYYNSVGLPINIEIFQ